MQAAHPVVVTAMGRHPGWPNVIDQFGRINSTAHMARRVVFEHGLSLAAARGVWDKVPEASRLDGLTHDVLWLPAAVDGAQGGAVGRVWMSRDGSGRSGPMMVMSSVESAPVGWVAEQVLPRLAAVERMCRETNASELVRLSIGEAQHQVEDTLAMLVGKPRPGESDEEAMAALSHAHWPGALPREEQYARVVQAVEGGAAHLRVPRVLEGVSGVRAWGAVVRGVVQDQRSVLVMARDRAMYLDVFIGGPDAQSLLVLRAGERHTGLTTESGGVPSPEAVQQAAARLAGMGRAGASPVSAGKGGGKRGLALLVVGGLLVAGVAAALLFTRGKKPADGPGAGLRPLVLEQGQEHVDGPRAPGTRPPLPAGSVGPDVDAGVGAGGSAEAELGAVEEGLGALRQELEDQGLAPASALAERASALRERVRRGGEAGGALSEARLLRRDVDAARGEAAGRVLTYLREQASSPPAGLPEQAWSSRVMRIAPRAGMANARREVGQARAEMVGAAQGAARGFDIDIPAGAPVDVRALRSALAAHRERAVRGAVAGEKAAADPWPSLVRDGVEAATRLDSALRAGKTMDEVEEGRTVREWASRLRSAEEDVEVGAAVSAVEGRVRALERAGGIGGVDELLATVKDASDASGDRISELRTAWRRLGEQDWPSDAEGFGTLGDMMAGTVDPAVGVMEDAAARAQVRESISQDARAMWRRGVERSVRDEGALRGAVDAMGRVGVTEEDVAHLPEWAQFSIARERLLGVLGGGDAGAVRAAAAGFVVEGADKDRRWPGLQTKLAGVDAVCAAARRVVNGGGPSLAGLGPGAAGWTLAVGEGGELIYSSAEGVTATFKKEERAVAAPPSRRETYLATGEFSVAQASAVARDPKWSEALRAALPDYRLDSSDPRQGVRTWGWVRVSGKGWDIRPPENNAAGGWQRVRGGAGAGEGAVAPDVVKSAISADAPMQYVSPDGAAVLAAAMGCRLVGVDEWKKAASGSDPGVGNLRDEQFARQAAWVRAKGAEARVGPPAIDIFRPSNSQLTSSVDDIQSAVSGDDKALWFTGEQEHGAFVNLVGNVAEFVVDDPSGLTEGVAPGAGGVAAAGLRVIGGSALSNGYPTLEPQPVEVARAGSGFADVGFRIAFTAPAGAAARSPLQELRDALGRQPPVFPDR